MKKLLLVILVIILPATGVYTWLSLTKDRPTSKQVTNKQRTLNPNSTYSLKGQTYQVEIADTQEKRELGLSGIKNIEPNQGMLFVFPETSTPTFWMKDMLFNIDIYWISNGEVIGVVYNAAPPDPYTDSSSLKLYSPPGPVDTVLEIKSGK